MSVTGADRPSLAAQDAIGRLGPGNLVPCLGALEGAMIRGSLSHLDLTVVDLQRSVDFYHRVLGWLGYRGLDEVGAGAPCWGISEPCGGFFTIALKPARAESRTTGHDRYAPGLHHLAFHADSRDDVDAFHDFLLGIGATILDPPAEYDYTPGYYAVFFADPDGIKLEVVFEPELRGRANP
jgi:glyoxylase I family protein